MILVLLAGGVEAALFLPPAGVDKFPSSKAMLVVEIGGEIRDVAYSGPTIIGRSDPRDNRIKTEIISMQLACTDGKTLRLNPNRRSTGQIQVVPDPAGSFFASFFNVFFQIDVPDVGTVENRDPVKVKAKFNDIPPHGTVYSHAQPVDLFLAGTLVGSLVSALHDTNGTPPGHSGESVGEVSPVFSCFYECKRRANTWLELTTLMLVNQSAKQPLTAEILFVDGHQNPIARTSTNLSPEDLDEMNVCETLDKGGIAVPPAGVIEVVLSAGTTGVPVGGAYGWVKNLTGTFTRSVPEPFEGRVTGIAKTECRLVGPNVVTPSEIRAKSAPTIQPILIEGTAE